MRIVSMDDFRLPLAEDAGQLPRRREIDLVARRQRHQVGPFGCPSIELAFRVRNQHSAMPEGAQPQDRQEDLVLSAAPCAGGVDVEGEHSSQSFANFTLT